MTRLTGKQQYNRRHYATNKLYFGVCKDGKTSKSVLAYTAAEARAEIRKSGFKPVKIVRG